MSLCAATLSIPGCTGADDQLPALSEASIEAVEIWTHSDTAGIGVIDPLDFKAASRNEIWAIDGFGGGIVRYEASVGSYGVFGIAARPPAEVVKPARLAIADQSGVFVFDDSTNMVDLYSPDGQHLRGFDPGIRPSILEVSQRPLRLTYGVLSVLGDTIPTLTVIQTNFLGQHPDTLLSPNVGPESLRRAPAVPTKLVSAPASSGLWIFSAAHPDTVFEVAGAGPSRKLVLPEPDTRRGILTDLQQEILWVVVPRPAGGLVYEAYDISEAGIEGIIDGGNAYLGVRTTPLGFTGIAAFDGSVSGWWRTSDQQIFSPQGYDMRLDELRRGAATARELRPLWRAKIADEWARARAAADSARQAVTRDTLDAAVAE